MNLLIISEERFQALLEIMQTMNSKLDTLLRNQAMNATATDANFAALQTQVEQSVTVEESALTLINGFAAQLAAATAAANNGDSAALPALQQQLQTSAAALAAAVAANTPAAPAAAAPKTP